MAYEKFMHNKYFHPASIQNIKKVRYTLFWASLFRSLLLNYKNMKCY